MAVVRHSLQAFTAIAQHIRAGTVETAGHHLLRRRHCRHQRGAGAGHARTQERQGVRRIIDRMGRRSRITDGSLAGRRTLRLIHTQFTGREEQTDG